MIFNYFLGVTCINLRDYILSMLGVIPHFMIWIYIGITLESIQSFWNGQYKNENDFYLIIVGIVLILIVFIYITIETKKKMKI